MRPCEQRLGIASDGATRKRLRADETAALHVDDRLKEKIDLLVRNDRFEHQVARGRDGRHCPEI